MALFEVQEYIVTRVHRKPSVPRTPTECESMQGAGWTIAYQEVT